jgi:hypothetical protein
LKEYIDRVYQLKKDGSLRKNQLDAEGKKDELAAESARVEVYKLILNSIYGFTIVNRSP